MSRWELEEEERGKMKNTITFEGNIRDMNIRRWLPKKHSYSFTFNDGSFDEQSSYVPFNDGFFIIVIVYRIEITKIPPHHF